MGVTGVAMAQPAPTADIGSVLGDFQNRVVRIAAKHAPGSDGENGYGFVIGEGADGSGKPIVVVVTADHVVRTQEEPERQYDPPMVTFFVDQPHPQTGRLLPLRLPQATGDLAVLEVPKSSKYSSTPANMAPVWSLQRRAEAWPIGNALDDWEWPQSGGRYIGPSGPFKLQFKGLQAAAGTSGAPVVSEHGLVGMLVEDGGVQSSSSLVLAADIIRRVVVNWGLPWDIGITQPPACPKPQSTIDCPTTPAPINRPPAPPPSACPIPPASSPEEIAQRVAALLKSGGAASPAGVPAAQIATAVARYNRGVAIARPGNSAPNWREAAYWYALAAKQGYPSAYTRLGLIVALGQAGDPPDLPGAAVLWLRGSLLGDGAASFNLADMYKEGLGVPVDLASAWAWYKVAEMQGVKEASVQLRQLQPLLLQPLPPQ